MQLLWEMIGRVYRQKCLGLGGWRFVDDMPLLKLNERHSTIISPTLVFGVAFVLDCYKEGTSVM